MKLSKRSNIDGFRALENMRICTAMVANGADVVRLEAGQPCFGVPDAVMDAAKAHMGDNPMQGYTDAMGRVDVRTRLARYYRDTYNADIPIERICLTTGSSCGFILAFIAAFDAGDTVAMTIPTYPAYRNILKSLDINVIEIPSTAETNFQPTVDLLEASGHTFDGLIVNSPSNPTGTIIDDGELENIAKWCEEKGVRLISDEAYHGITYGGMPNTVANMSEHAIVLNTFSKYFAMTGWRLGWLIVPEDMAIRIKSLSENLYVSAPTITQHVALNVLDHTDTLNNYVAHYKRNRDILLNGLPDAGLDKLSSADGAFYIYADIGDYSDDSEAFSAALLADAGVCVTSGKDFDPVRGHETIRISYAGTPEDMHRAVERIGAWLK